MATPGTLVQQSNKTIERNTMNQLTFLVKDFDGVLIDVSAGWVAVLHYAARRGELIPVADLVATWTFTAEGEAIATLSKVESLALSAGEYEYDVQASNDAYVTVNRISKGRLSVLENLQGF